MEALLLTDDRDDYTIGTDSRLTDGQHLILSHASGIYTGSILCHADLLTYRLISIRGIAVLRIKEVFRDWHREAFGEIVVKDSDTLGNGMILDGIGHELIHVLRLHIQRNVIADGFRLNGERLALRIEVKTMTCQNILPFLG